MEAVLAQLREDGSVEQPTHFSLERIEPVPVPLLLEEPSLSRFGVGPNRNPVRAALEKRFGAADYHDWRDLHWGTKWDVEAEEAEVTIDGDRMSAVFNFESAWSPPTPAIETIAKRHPELHLVLEADEPGNNFWIRQEWSGGEMFVNEEGDSKIAAAWAEQEEDELEAGDGEGLDSEGV